MCWGCDMRIPEGFTRPRKACGYWDSILASQCCKVREILEVAMPSKRWWWCGVGDIEFGLWEERSEESVAWVKLLLRVGAITRPITCHIHLFSCAPRGVAALTAPCMNHRYVGNWACAVSQLHHWGPTLGNGILRPAHDSSEQREPLDWQLGHHMRKFRCFW